MCLLQEMPTSQTNTPNSYQASLSITPCLWSTELWDGFITLAQVPPQNKLNLIFSKAQSLFNLSSLRRHSEEKYKQQLPQWLFIHWSDRQKGQWGHWPLCFRGLPWLINDRDEPLNPLSALPDLYYQIHARQHKVTQCEYPILHMCVSNLN